MSDKVIKFPGKKSQPYPINDKQKVITPARCTACNHEWMSTTPVGEFAGIKCPECHLNFGMLLFPSLPESFWTCGECDSPVFSICGESRDIVCWRCGAAQVWGDV